MKTKTLFRAVTLSAVACRTVLLASEPCVHRDLPGAPTAAAISSDKSIAAAGCATLRAQGQPGLDALMAAHRDSVVAMRQGRLPLSDDTAQRLRGAVDCVAKQRDAFASGLYWYTDLDEARSAARTMGRPILSLRLLGRLDEEFSCANSRFFRTTLYANQEIAAFLREHFVLHWKSVRPVPHITIDFGDGRILERTVTGNSVHYILAADGAVIDALPGLQSPGQFLAALRDGFDLAQQADGSTAQGRIDLYTRFHRRARERLEKQWAADLARIGAEPQPLHAVRAANREEAGLPNAVWTRIAALHSDNARLDGASRALLRTKNPAAEEAGRRAVSKTVVESPLLRAMRNLEATIAEDTVRNEYLFHSQIHEWLANAAMRDVDALNRRVYAELFLTPDSDPWLGLKTEQTLTALEGDGLRSAGHR